MKIFKDLAYGPYKDNVLDLYLPEEECHNLFLYFHGGGLEHGSKNLNVDNLPSYLISQGIAVASAEYRMYPSAKYPDFVEDAAAAAAWLKKNIGQYGDYTHIFIGGSSAGGYLSMMLCFDEKWFAAHDLTPNDFAGFVHDAGQPTNHFNVLRERGIDTRRVMIDDSAPLYHIGKAESYPPMLFIVSDNDMENRYEQTQLVLSTLRHFRYDMSKVKYTLCHGTHCAYVSKIEEDGTSTFGKMICEFIKEY